MKFLLILILSVIVVVPALAAPLSDRTGLKTKFDVDVGGITYVVETVANFNIDDVRFDNDALVLQMSGGLKNNLLEMQIPNNMTAGKIHMFLDGQEVASKVLSDQKISFVTLEFSGNGTHVLEVKSDFTVKPHESYYEPSPSLSPVHVFLIVAIGAIAAGVAMMYKKRKTTR